MRRAPGSGLVTLQNTTTAEIDPPVFRSVNLAAVDINPKLTYNETLVAAAPSSR